MSPFELPEKNRSSIREGVGKRSIPSSLVSRRRPLGNRICDQGGGNRFLSVSNCGHERGGLRVRRSRCCSSSPVSLTLPFYSSPNFPLDSLCLYLFHHSFYPLFFLFTTPLSLLFSPPHLIFARVSTTQHSLSVSHFPVYHPYLASDAYAEEKSSISSSVLQIGLWSSSSPL